MKRDRTTHIIVHGAFTPPSMDIGVDEIRRWHKEDNLWDDIGYHYVIRRDGRLERGRDLEMAGIHTRRFNGVSVGICLVGGKSEDKSVTGGVPNYTPEQYDTLAALCAKLQKRYPEAVVCGHRDCDENRTCPYFDVQTWWEGHGNPGDWPEDDDHTLERIASALERIADTLEERYNK